MDFDINVVVDHFDATVRERRVPAGRVSTAKVVTGQTIAVRVDVRLSSRIANIRMAGNPAGIVTGQR